MNKFLRKAMILALAGTMTLGMSSTALAAENTTPASNLNTSDSVASDTTTINLIKDYVRGEGTASDSASPAENFVFTITPYGVWNAGSSTGAADGAAYTVGNMPALAIQSTNVTLENDKQTNIVTVSAAAKKAVNSESTKTNDIKTEIKLNDFKSVGDFWYQVVETNAHRTGVFYGTNDSVANNVANANGGHNATYYIHVQVVNNPSYDGTTNTKKFYRSVTLHKTAPVSGNSAPDTNAAYNTWANDNYTSSVKVNDIQNTYYAGDLSIAKVVTGNAGDKDKRFEVTVTFTKPAETIITSDIAYSAAGAANETAASNKTIVNQNSESSSWKTKIGGETSVGNNSTNVAYAQVKIYIKDGETVTFKNIPYGVTYTITETQPQDDKYTHSFTYVSGEANTANTTNLTFDGKTYAADTVTVEDGDKTGEDKWNAANATGSITDDLDTVTITNTKESTIDVGVITSNAPYAAMLVLAGLAVLLYVRRRKNMIEE